MNTRCVVHNQEKVCNSDHIPIVVKLIVHDRSRLHIIDRKSIAGGLFDTYDDKTTVHTSHIKTSLFSGHPSTLRTDLSLENIVDAVVNALLSVSATTRSKRTLDHMQRSQIFQ